MRSFDDTICAPATIPGTGAICIIRVSGPDAIAATSRIAGSSSLGQAEGYSIRHLPIEGVDDVLVSVFRAPKSYTGEDCVEISCHSSAVIAEDIIGKLRSEGVRLAEPGEFTLRAYLNGKMDLSQAEAVADIIGANGKVSRDIALKQLKGSYSSELKSLRNQMKQIASLLELELDFSEEEVEFASREKVRALLNAAESRIEELTASFAKGDAIKNGIPVAIAGAPNSGKSTLLNALAGEERAIVSAIAGTTRDTIEETIDIEGLKFRIIDTAGIRETKDEIEGIGISRAFDAITKARVVLVLQDATNLLQADGNHEGDGASKDFTEKEVDCGQNERGRLMDAVIEKLPSGCTLLQVITKCDLVSDRLKSTVACLDEGVGNISRTVLDGCKDNSSKDVRTVCISAKTGFGMDVLKKEIAGDFRNCLSEGVVVTSQRHFEALQDSLNAIRSATRSLDEGIPTDLLAEDLRTAINSLSTIWGETISSTEVLNNIFSRFCIGK